MAQTGPFAASHGLDCCYTELIVADTQGCNIGQSLAASFLMTEPLNPQLLNVRLVRADHGAQQCSRGVAVCHLPVS